jgi:N-acetylmuramoyl-L-alanine amidase
MQIQQDFLTHNIFSRPGKKLESVRGIVIHYVANPGSSARANRNYWESLKMQSLNDPKAVYASAHFIVGLSGEIIQTLPIDEMGYHVGAKTYTPEARSRLGHYPNNCTIGIELYHPDKTGKFDPDTYVAGVDLTASLVNHFKLDPARDIWTHNGITGKICPKWFVDHPDAFDRFKLDVDIALENSEEDIWTETK